MANFGLPNNDIRELADQLSRKGHLWGKKKFAIRKKLLLELCFPNVRNLRIHLPAYTDPAARYEMTDKYLFFEGWPVQTGKRKVHVKFAQLLNKFFPALEYAQIVRGKFADFLTVVDNKIVYYEDWIGTEWDIQVERNFVDVEAALQRCDEEVAELCEYFDEPSTREHMEQCGQCKESYRSNSILPCWMIGQGVNGHTGPFA